MFLESICGIESVSIGICTFRSLNAVISSDGAPEIALPFICARRASHSASRQRWTYVRNNAAYQSRSSRYFHEPNSTFLYIYFVGEVHVWLTLHCRLINVARMLEFVCLRKQYRNEFNAARNSQRRPTRSGRLQLCRIWSESAVFPENSMHSECQYVLFGSAYLRKCFCRTTENEAKRGRKRMPCT